jgi:hypothetical protein
MNVPWGTTSSTRHTGGATWAALTPSSRMQARAVDTADALHARQINRTRGRAR